MPTTPKVETDWNRVGEIIAEKLEDFMLQNGRLQRRYIDVFNNKFDE